MISFCKWSRERSDMGSIKVLFAIVTRRRTLFNETTAGSNNVYCQTMARMLISIAKRTVLFALGNTPLLQFTSRTWAIARIKGLLFKFEAWRNKIVPGVFCRPRNVSLVFCNVKRYCIMLLHVGLAATTRT